MPAIDAPDDLSLVPPGRLGALVAGARRGQDLTIEQVASRSGGRLSVHDVKLLEAGRLAVEDHDVRLLAELLGLPLGRIVPQRAELVIDRTEGRVIAGDSVGRFVSMAGPDEVARRYLALVRALRGHDFADDAAVALRAGDLEVLADSLFLTVAEVRDLLDGALAADAATITAMCSRSATRPFMPGLGLLVAFTSLGGLLLVPASASSAASSASGASGGGIVRSATAATGVLASGAIVRTSSIAYERPSTTTVRIGTALVIERGDDGSVTESER
jgi:hypothetical protein